jgi:hypothetical protein
VKVETLARSALGGNLDASAPVPMEPHRTSFHTVNTIQRANMGVSHDSRLPSYRRLPVTAGDNAAVPKPRSPRRGVGLHVSPLGRQ